jgi:putative ABC transport system ATP-binding protein
MKIIEVKDAIKSFQVGDNTINAVNDVSFSINEGDFIAFVGQSGSGKSTLMNLIGCLDVPTSGNIFVNGVDITKLSDNALSDIRSKSVGFVFQSFNLLPHITALENVETPLLYQNVSKKERIRRASDLLKLVGLGDRMHHRPNELSGGQRQRVSIARALVNDPLLILADEPTGALDSKTGLQIMDLFRMLNKQGKTIVFVTHDNKLAAKCDSSIRLEDGKIIK